MDNNFTIPTKVVDYGDLTGFSWRNGKKVLVLGVGKQGSTITKCAIACPVDGMVTLIVLDFETGWKWLTSTNLDLPEGKVQKAPLTK